MSKRNHYFRCMKYAIVILWLVPLFASAQNCKVKTTKDPYTREVKVSTGLVLLTSGQYSIEATKAQIDIMFSIEGKCFDDASTAAVFFEGTKQRTNFKNAGPMNCQGLFHLTFRNTNPAPSSLQNLGSKKISSVKFKDNTAKETTITLNADQQETLMQLINCMIDAGKKLSQ